METFEGFNSESDNPWIGMCSFFDEASLDPFASMEVVSRDSTMAIRPRNNAVFNSYNTMTHQEGNKILVESLPEEKKRKKLSSEDAPKEDSKENVRAKRGRSTNSHSLAERLRRERIGERMKFLQDIVPGCNKITGKAVMLDEIINYVLSMQRQVELLSVKLASMNPETNFGFEQGFH